MDDNSISKNSMKFLRRLREKGKAFPEIQKNIQLLQEEALTQGLNNATLRMVLEILMHVDLGVANSISLIKCMIPKGNIEDADIKLFVSWFLTIPLPVTTLSMILQWIIGCWEYQLISRSSIYIFYDAFFHILLQQERLEPRLAQLIYLITKPEDVTRRQVTRLLKLNQRNRRPRRHIIALLSLFKSYKPEFVPEKISAINIQSIWQPLPEILRTGFEDAKERINVRQSMNDNETCFNWNVFSATKRKKRNEEPLVPSVKYFNIGSNLYKNSAEKSVFDVTTTTDLGRHHNKLQLPCNATSLLTNLVGYHLLTYADFEYQQRFMHNLYFTLWRSFIFENGKYSDEEMDKVLDMTMEFCRYMQHGIPIVNYFIHEYLSCFVDELHLKLLSLIQWSSVSVSECQDYVLKHMKLMFYSSSLNIKCKIIRTLKSLLVNLSVINDDSFKDETFPFLGLPSQGNLEDIVKIIENVAKELIISALNIDFYNPIIISEALSFYEQINALEIYKKTSFITLPSPSMIYGSFVTKSCALLSGICALLLQFGKHELEQKMSVKNRKRLIIYVEDFMSALWYENCFSNRLANNRYFLRRLTDNTVKNVSCNIDNLLSLRHHLAVLPYMYLLRTSGIKIKTKDKALEAAGYYFFYIEQFINIVLRKSHT